MPAAPTWTDMEPAAEEPVDEAAVPEAEPVLEPDADDVLLPDLLLLEAPVDEAPLDEAPEPAAVVLPLPVVVAPAPVVWPMGKKLWMQACWHAAYLAVSSGLPEPWSHFAAH